MPESIIQETKIKFDKAIEAFDQVLSSQISTSIHPEVISSVPIVFDRAVYKLSHVASISLEGPHVLAVKPWDQSMCSKIEHALHDSRLMLQVSSREKNVIHVQLPALTQERRELLMKEVKKLGEQYKVNIRNIRSTQKNKLKVLIDNLNIDVNKAKKLHDNLQDMVHLANEKIDILIAKKQKDLTMV